MKGLRIGVLEEGFRPPELGSRRRRACARCSQRFAGLGAAVEDISLPAHASGFPVWAAIRGDAACITLLEMNGVGINHEGLYVTSLLDKAMGWRSQADSFADTFKIASIFSRYTLDRYGGHFYAKAQNVRRRLRAAYDKALAATICCCCRPRP